jgi:DNA topoisomerase-2
MKGKPLNVMNAGPIQISKNTEIIGLKTLLGLTEGLDYTIEKNFNTLRYGYFVILDDDGKHIIGLILNLFYCRYPSLLQRGYVLFMRTPILRANRRGLPSQKFYRDVDYQEWKNNTEDYSKWNIKYYKGLASSNKKDIEEDYLDPRTILCFYDDNAPSYMELAFDSKLTDIRKHWIASYNQSYFDMVDVLPISSFVNTELIEYAIANVARSIPRFLDGLKNSQRKALWTSFDKWPARTAPKESQQMKVSQFASRVSDFTDYRHGETSMCDTICGMAQSYVGSNNIPYFLEDGQFGTRDKMGSDCGSSRYIYTRPSPILPYIFRKEDDLILTLLPGDKIGEVVEPLVLFPIIPMQLVNGALGIGTAWSTFIPNFNPLDVIDVMKSIISGEVV